MLKKLTKKQEAMIPIVLQQWIDKIYKFDYSKVDREKIKLKMEWIYDFCGKSKPQVYIMDSPMGAQYCYRILKHDGANIRDNIGDNIGANIRDNIRANIRANIRDNIRANIGDNIRANIRANIRDNIGANIRDNIGDNIGANIRDNIRANKKIEYQYMNNRGSVQDWNWFAFYDYFQQIGIILGPQNDNFTKLKEISDLGVYDILYYEGLCIVSLLPTVCKSDDKMRLHKVDGMAIQWNDGYGEHYIHGVHFSKDDLEKSKNIEAKELLNWKNQDQKRAMIMECDYSKLLKEANAEKLDTAIDGNGHEMNLYRVDLGDDTNKAVFYEAIDPSKNEKIVLRVHPTEVKTCMEGKLWTWKFLWDKYKEKEEIEFVKET